MDRLNGCTLDSTSLICKHDTFCICQLPAHRERVVNGKEHDNDMILCIRSAENGVHQFEVNARDMGLLAQVAIAGMKAGGTRAFSIRYLFNEAMFYDMGILYRVCKLGEGVG